MFTAKVTYSPSEVVAVPENPEVVTDPERPEHKDGREEGGVGGVFENLWHCLHFCSRVEKGRSSALFIKGIVTNAFP